MNKFERFLDRHWLAINAVLIGASWTILIGAIVLTTTTWPLMHSARVIAAQTA